VQRLEEIVPEGAVAPFQVRSPAIELVEVEDEVDLDVPLLADEFVKAKGKGLGVEGGGDGRVHGCTSSAHHWYHAFREAPGSRLGGARCDLPAKAPVQPFT